MRPTVPVLLAAAAALVGCPLPQPLPDYPPGTVTPPRIVVDDSVTTISQPGTIVRVPAPCSNAPSFALDAQIREPQDIVRPITVRWFVNYDASDGLRRQPTSEETVSAAVPGDPTLRDVSAWTFYPYGYSYDSITTAQGDAAGAIHIVELVISDGFYTPDNEAPLPYRSPEHGHEVQVYRWVFFNDSSVPCP